MKVHACSVIALAFASNVALACPNLNGAFEVESSRGRKTVETIAQQGCEKIVLGVVKLKSGKVVEKIEGVQSYLNRNLPASCVGSSCLYFEENEASLKLTQSGLISIGSDLSEYPCFFNEVAFSITPKGDLRKTYSLVSILADHPCARFKSFTEEFRRVRSPQISTALGHVRR